MYNFFDFYITMLIPYKNGDYYITIEYFTMMIVENDILIQLNKAMSKLGT